jgi:hypothetical protein
MPTSFKILGIGLLLSLVSFMYVQQDLRLRIWGKTVVADVMDDYESTSRRTKRVTSLGIDYRFVDEKGDTVRGGAHVPLDYKGEKMAPVGDDAAFAGIPRVLAVKVIYLPGKPEINRLATASTFWPYLFFFGGLAILAIGILIFKNETVVEAHKETAESLESQEVDLGNIAKKTARSLLRMPR